MVEPSVDLVVEGAVAELLKQLQQLSEKAIEELMDMDEQEFELFTDRRQQLTERLILMRSHVTDRDREQIAYILKFDDIILKRMTALKDEAGHWMEQQSRIKVQKNAYQHAYSANSMFFDHRN